jgi:hypothetical protein
VSDLLDRAPAISGPEPGRHSRNLLGGGVSVVGTFCDPTRKLPLDIDVKEWRFACRHIAELSGAVVLEVEAPDGSIPDAKARAGVHKEVAKLHHENLLIFVDRERTQSLWYWVKRQDGKQVPRDHLYFKESPGNGLLPLYEGKMISQFDHRFAEPRYWIPEKGPGATHVSLVPESGWRLPPALAGFSRTWKRCVRT